MQVDAGGVDDGVLGAGASGAEAPGRDAEGQRLHAVDHSVAVGHDGLGLARCGKRGIRIAALSPDERPPRVHRPPVGERRLDVGIRLTGQGEHLPRQRDGQLDDIRRSAAREHLDRLAHLVRVADGEPEGRVHVGEQCRRRDARVGAELDHRARELAGLVDVAHEGAGAELHIEHQRVGALRDLLRHDARGDQRDRLDGAGDIAQRVELLVGRREAGAGGADDGSDVAELVEQLLVRERRPPAGDGLELVERSAGVAEAAARELRHGDAERGDQRRERAG